jgi:chemotaxis family two-component system response regulator Rcp1
MKTARIVLIEDNTADVLLVKMALKHAGITFELQHFDTGHSAAANLCEPENVASSAPDAIIMDLNTPRSDGFEILGRLTSASHLQGVPIVLLSSSRAWSDKNRAQTQGVRYVVKPTQYQDFISTIGSTVTEMLNGEKPPAP